MAVTLETEKTMAVKLSNIAITHISLVKAGANKKQTIYKSADADPVHEKKFEIAKVDDERGMLYGIVYAPDEEDTQGDFTTADEIEKAAYGFMKALNLENVDREHDFQKRDAYVAESWLIRKGDPLFPDEKEGAWAVGIRLESEELRKAAKDGDIAGLSMAGVAERETVEKADAATSLISQIANAFEDLYVNMSGRIKKTEKETEEVKPEEITKAIQTGMEPIAKEMKELKEQNEQLARRLDETEAALKKSGQWETPAPKHEDEETTGGIL